MQLGCYSCLRSRSGTYISPGPASMLASEMTLLGSDWMVSLSCSYSAPSFLGAVSGCVMVNARDSNSREEGKALHSIHV